MPENNKSELAGADIKASVRKGAALLDEKLPDWFEKVEKDSLDMGRYNLDVIGQVYQCPGYIEYIPVIRELSALPLVSDADINAFLFEYGLSVREGKAIPEQQEAWLSEINIRLKSKN